jgi:hypothetical protein
MTQHPARRWPWLSKMLMLAVLLVPCAHSQVISSLTCRQVNLISGEDSTATCSGLSNWAYFNSIKFIASGICESGCEAEGISTSLTLNIGQNSGPCDNPVRYTFWAAVENATQANPSYIYVSMYAADTMVEVEASVSTDCTGFVQFYGPQETDFPC